MTEDQEIARRLAQADLENGGAPPAGRRHPAVARRCRSGRRVARRSGAAGRSGTVPLRESPGDRQGSRRLVVDARSALGLLLLACDV